MTRVILTVFAVLSGLLAVFYGGAFVIWLLELDVPDPVDWALSALWFGAMAFWMWPREDDA